MACVFYGKKLSWVFWVVMVSIVVEAFGAAQELNKLPGEHAKKMTKRQANKALWEAAYRSDIKKAAEAFDAGADANASCSGITVLWVAISKANSAMVRMLLDNNASVNKTSLRQMVSSFMVITPLIESAWRGDHGNNEQRIIATMLVLAGAYDMLDHPEKKPEKGMRKVIAHAYRVKQQLGEQDWSLEDLVDFEVIRLLFPRDIGLLVGEYAITVPDMGDSLINELCRQQLERNRVLRIALTSTKNSQQFCILL